MRRVHFVLDVETGELTEVADAPSRRDDPEPILSRTAIEPRAPGVRARKRGKR